MYGLLLMNMQEYVEKTFGAKKWVEVKEALKIKVTLIKEIIIELRNSKLIISYQGTRIKTIILQILGGNFWSS